MLFINPEILQNNNDIKIGKVEVEGETIDYLNYLLKVKLRVLKLIIDFIKSDMADGATYDESVKDCLGLVYETLNIDDKTYPTDAEGIFDEIEKSEEFQNWSADIKYRFLNTHVGVVRINTPISITGNKHPNISEETLELIKEDDSFQVFLDGLAATNYND